VVRISGIVADMDPEVSASVYREIEELIASEDSPLGINAKKTHVIIIQKAAADRRAAGEARASGRQRRHLTQALVELAGY
jgi:hypothetical protein